MKPLRPDLSLTTTRFVAGTAFNIRGFEVRLVPGHKAPDDLRLDVRSRDWHTVRFDTLGLLFDALYENEHRLYRPSLGHQGGEKLRDYITNAIRYGHDKAATELRLEQSAKAQRLFDEPESA